MEKMEDWKTLKLGEIAEVIDCPHSTPKWTEKGVFVIRSWNVRNGRLVLDKQSFTDEQTYRDRIKRAIPTEGDIVLTREAPMGELCMIPTGLKCCIGQRIVLLKVNKTIDNVFLLYSLQSPIVQKRIKASEGTGSTVSNFRIPDIKALELSIPKDINKQRSIASILSSLDEKIELNLQMNRTLEAIAQAIFKEWFVDFRFPGFDGELMDGLPKGWKREELGNVLETVLGGTPSTTNKTFWESGTIPWINSGKVNEFRIIVPSTYITETALNNSNTKLLPKGTTVLAITGATLGQISRLEIDASANQSVVGILENETLKSEFIYLWINHNIRNIIKGQTGGAQQHINKNDINKSDLLVPEGSILNKFQTLVDPIFGSISNNCFHNQILIDLRDSLLPKLMTGKIKVA